MQRMVAWLNLSVTGSTGGSTCTQRCHLEPSVWNAQSAVAAGGRGMVDLPAAKW
jgi:hypothetical protein